LSAAKPIGGGATGEVHDGFRFRSTHPTGPALKYGIDLRIDENAISWYALIIKRGLARVVEKTHDEFLQNSSKTSMNGRLDF
jgi:hypothetical protein